MLVVCKPRNRRTGVWAVGGWNALAHIGWWWWSSEKSTTIFSSKRCASKRKFFPSIKYIQTHTHTHPNNAYAQGYGLNTTTTTTAPSIDYACRQWILTSVHVKHLLPLLHLPDFTVSVCLCVLVLGARKLKSQNGDFLLLKDVRFNEFSC